MISTEELVGNFKGIVEELLANPAIDSELKRLLKAEIDAGRVKVFELRDPSEDPAANA